MESDKLLELQERSVIYAILARGFSHPDKSVVDFFASLDIGETAGETDLSRRAAKVAKLGQQSSAEELQSAYMAMFDPTNGPFPYEVEFSKGQEFSKAHLLADIMGFYHAFGVEPLRDRADSIDAELEFMHLLVLKEHHALQSNDNKKAQICRDAQEKFFCEHLSRLAGALLEQKGALPAFYDSLYGLLEEFMKTELAGLSGSSCAVGREAVP